MYAIWTNILEISITDTEYKAKFGAEKYKQLVAARNEMMEKARQFESSSSHSSDIMDPS
jgi:hypothetical protein